MTQVATETGSLLRFVTCGSVDDGKSTLIGRLLFDSKGIFEDQLSAVQQASGKYGTTGAGKVDLALLTDGLKAEREQGITIDVAYRYFSTPNRPFVIADCPGHEQYTRNMATGASTADVAILLIDARHGVVTQTRRHGFIVSLLGIRHVVLAVNKMDLAGWSRDRFEQIVRDFEQANERIGLRSITAIPMSALNGDNVTTRTDVTPWYDGPTLLEFLETVDLTDPRDATRPFRLPVQLVSRPDSNFRGYMGEIASGSVKPGDAVTVLPAGVRTEITRVFDADGEAAELHAGQAGTIVLAKEVDASRGDMICAAGHLPHVATRVLAHLVWFSPEPLALGSVYRLKHSTRLTTGTVTRIRHRVDINTLDHHSAAKLDMNDIALVELESARPLVFDAYRDNRTTGSFVLIDRISGNTVAAGMIVSELSATDTAGPVTPLQRAVRLGQRPAVINLFGDHDVANDTAITLESLLFALGHLAVIIDEPDLSRRGAAVKAVTTAGLIALVIGDWPSPAAYRSLNKSDAPDDIARDLLKQLRQEGFLSAPTSDFDI